MKYFEFYPVVSVKIFENRSLMEFLDYLASSEKIVSIINKITSTFKSLINPRK